MVYCIDSIEIDATQACIRRDGQEVHLKPKTFRVLLHLLTNRDRLVTKEELMDLFWKDVPVTDDALTQCIAETRRALGDNPRNPIYVKTIPRLGFRFIGVVRDEALALAEAPSLTETSSLPEAPSRVSRGRAIWAVIAVLIAVSAGTAALWTTSPRNVGAIAAKRQIAVLRFENRSGQQELDWLRDGLPEMLATTFSRSRNLDVVSREQVYSRAARSGKTGGDAAVEVARALRAQIAIGGSFSKLGNSMRVDVRVYQAETGNLLASEDIAVDRQDQLLAQVDFLALRVASRIAPSARDEDRRVLTSLMTENLEAYRYYSLGLEKADAYQTDEALALFQKALALDPKFVMASARIGYAYAVTNALIAEGRPYLEKAFRMSDRLTEKDRRHIVAWYAIANQDYETAIRRYSELIAAYPNEAEGYFRLGALLRGESRHEEAVDILREGMAIDPEDPRIPNALAAVYSEMGRHEEAIAMANRYISLVPATANAYDSLGLAYEFAGQFDRALEAFAKALEVNPDFAIARLHMGTVYGQTGRVRECIQLGERFDKTGGSDNDRQRAWEQAGYYAWRYGFRNESKAILDRVIALRPKGWVDTNPASIAFASNESIPSSTVVQPGRGYRWGQRNLTYYFAERARANGRAEDRLNLLQKALQCKMSWGTFEPQEDALADAYLDVGRVDDAIREYERALKVFPGMAMARFHLAQAYENKGLHAAAKAQYRAVLEIWRNADADLPQLAYARKHVM